MALNENAVRREAYKLERTEQSMAAAAITAIGFPSVHASISAPAPSAPRV